MSHLILSHGKESGPNASKITRLDQIAAIRGHSCERPDYGTEASASARLSQLHALIDAGPSPGDVVLVGSSMGAYISAIASVTKPVRGLFLMAPPVFFRGLEPALRLQCAHVTIVHGWADELIDSSEVVAFARAYQAKLVLVNDDHRLSNSMPALEHEFRLFLEGLPKASP
jgi:pimeloyl-ACP methyl ester carboxylesterase